MIKTKYYGVRKGSKRPKLHEIPPSGHLPLRTAQAEYDKLQDEKQVLAKKAARMIKVMALRYGDDLPADLIAIKGRYAECERSSRRLLETYPRIRR